MCKCLIFGKRKDSSGIRGNFRVIGMFRVYKFCVGFFVMIGRVERKDVFLGVIFVFDFSFFERRGVWLVVFFIVRLSIFV